MISRTRIRALILALVAVLLMVGCTGTGQTGGGSPSTGMGTVGRGEDSVASNHPASFIRTNGRSFTVGGLPFRFVGVNIYDAASTDRYSCRAGSRLSDSELRSYLQDLRDRAGVTVLRFWAYQTYTAGATDWSGVDQVIAAARAAGMRVLPVLEDGPGNCTTSVDSRSKREYEGDSWYLRGYKVPYGNASLSYRDYVARVTDHYRNDPTILGWSMMNEADTNLRDGLGRSILVDFASDIATVIRQNDPNHLITVGTQSNGAPGASGLDFTAVYSLPQISFAEVHDWGYWGSDLEPMPGGVGTVPPLADSPACLPISAPIGCSFARSEALGKPLIVGEAGMVGRTSQERIRRARLMRAKMDAAFAAGAAGYLVWSVTSTETDGYDIDPQSDDPLLQQMQDVAGGLR